MDDLDAVTKELAQIQDELLALPVEAIEERYELRSRQDALRARARKFAGAADDGRTTEELLAELAALRQQLATIEGQQINVVSQSGGGSGTGEGSFGYADRINREIMSDADAIVARIGTIKGVLADRGVVPPDAL